MKILPVGAAVLVLLGTAAACGLDKLTAQSSARHVLVATLIATPELKLRPEMVAGLDASVLALDAGFVLDGGLALDAGLPFDAGFLGGGLGALTIPEQTLAYAFFGERQGDGLSAPPVPIPGAAVRISTGSGGSFQMKEEAGGAAFRLTSLDDPGFQYAEGERYQFKATAGGEVYVAELAAAPPRERIPAFHPDAGYLERDAGEELVFLRPDPPGDRDRDIAFITVVPVSQSGGQEEPTYTNIPTDALGLLRLVAGPGAYKTSKVAIPGSAFPEAERNYLVFLQTVRLGGPQSANLFISSAIFAGTADVAIVKTR